MEDSGHLDDTHGKAFGNINGYIARSERLVDVVKVSLRKRSLCKLRCGCRWGVMAPVSSSPLPFLWPSLLEPLHPSVFAGICLSFTLVFLILILCHRSEEEFYNAGGNVNLTILFLLGDSLKHLITSPGVSAAHIVPHHTSICWRPNSLLGSLRQPPLQLWALYSGGLCQPSAKGWWSSSRVG